MTDFADKLARIACFQCDETGFAHSYGQPDGYACPSCERRADAIREQTAPMETVKELQAIIDRAHLWGQ